MDDAARGQVAGSAAEVYEAFFVPALFGQFASAMVGLSGACDGDRLLDVATGTGVVARAAESAVGETGEVVGLDVNPGMLEVARRLSRHVTWVEGAAERLLLEDDSFDATTCQFALMFFEDRRTALREMRRVTKPTGRVVVATWADVSESPGYAAMVDLLDREIGRQAADALLAPFSIGTEASLAVLMGDVFDDVDVQRQHGTAQFTSLTAWMHTDIRGWTLSEMIDDETFDALLAAGRVALDRFVGDDGTVEFSTPALIAVGTA